MVYGCQNLMFKHLPPSHCAQKKARKMTSADLEAIKTIQQQINEEYEKLDELLDDFDRKEEVKKNDIFAKRTAFLKAEGPKNFWAAVVASHPDIVNDLLGPYDDRILASLEDFSVTYKEDGAVRIEMKFKPNEFFSDSVLWAEEFDGEDGAAYEFSGVNWKEGKGPLGEDEEEPERVPGKKHTRSDAQEDRGESLFSFFELLPPDPNSSEFDPEEFEGDDEELEELEEEYQNEVEDRSDLFQCFVEEIWEDPAGVFARGDGNEETS